MPEASFEDILLIPRQVKCKTCRFIAALDEPLRSQVRTAVGKAIYSDDVIARGFAKVETELNQAPKEGSVRGHRAGNHA